MTNINAIYIFTMSLRALKGRGNPSLRAKRGNLIKRLRLLRHFVPRNDSLFYEIAQPVPSKAKESSSLLAMTLE